MKLLFSQIPPHAYFFSEGFGCACILTIPKPVRQKGPGGAVSAFNRGGGTHRVQDGFLGRLAGRAERVVHPPVRHPLQLADIRLWMVRGYSAHIFMHAHKYMANTSNGWLGHMPAP